MGERVAVEIGDGTGEIPAAVAVIRLDRPPMNAIDSVAHRELTAAAQQVAGDDAVRAVVIWGGPKVFAAGADVKEFAAQDLEFRLRAGRALLESTNAIAAIGKPVIAAVTGYALGGGCEIAMSADFRISADNARWGQPEILLGLIPGMGGTQRLPRLVGVSKAKDLIYTGRFVDATEAHEIGLVDVMVPAAEVYPTALAMAAKFTRLPALALAAAKAAVDGGQDVDLATGLRLEAQLFTSLFGTDDGRNGMASFVENGPGKAVFKNAPA
jgi:enoyl-CoA hydratase/carnithine racemase